jgi:hypothetical protein
VIFIGDVHGQFLNYLALIEGVGSPTFQVGDMGVGFGTPLPAIAPEHRFIRGNHDDPALCEFHANHAGKFGYDPAYKLFWMGGAYSIDWMWRQYYERSTGIKVWWDDEQLSWEDLKAAKKLYLETTPEIVATHECPSSVRNILLNQLMIGFRPEKEVPSRTADVLQEMFELHKPRIWVFGHYHITKTFEHAGTEFTCLNELETLQI